MKQMATAATRAAVAIGVAASLAACGTSNLHVEGAAPSPSSPHTGPAFVIDPSTGAPMQRPRTLPLGEFAALSDVRWQSWGAATASATGELSGSWCLPGCQTHGYPARVVLDRLISIEGQASYYSHASVSGSAIPKEQAAQLRSISFPTTAGVNQ
jgi:hypothetical protein